MKKFIALFIAISMICAVLASCAKKEEQGNTTAPATTTDAPSTQESTEPTAEPTNETESKTATTEQAKKSDAAKKETTTKKKTTTTKRTTTTKPQTTTAAPAKKELPSYKTAAIENEIFGLVNNERGAAGKAELKWSNELHSIACIRAKEISEKYQHTRPSGGGFDSIFDEYGIKYTYIGENIARSNYENAEFIMDLWMDSEGHRKNILSGTYNKIGIGSYSSGGNIYVVQIFAE